MRFSEWERFELSEDPAHPIWIAISTYVLVAILKKHLQTELSLYTMLQILSVSSFQKIELSQVFSAAMSQKPEESTCNQLQLFDL